MLIYRNSSVWCTVHISLIDTYIYLHMLFTSYYFWNWSFNSIQFMVPSKMQTFPHDFLHKFGPWRISPWPICWPPAWDINQQTSKNRNPNNHVYAFLVYSHPKLWLCYVILCYIPLLVDKNCKFCFHIFLRHTHMHIVYSINSITLNELEDSSNLRLPLIWGKQEV